MSLHNVYCNVCNKIVIIELVGRPHDFMSWCIQCPCEEEKEVVIKKLEFISGYGLFNICDLVPSVNIINNLIEKHRKEGLYN